MGLMLLSTWVRHNGVDKKSIMYVGRMRAEPCGPNVAPQPLNVGYVSKIDLEEEEEEELH